MRGIALEGGGAKGAFHVGAIKALHELGIEYQAVAGTSIGAINGAIIAMGDLALLEHLWLSTEMEDMIGGDAEIIKSIMNFEFRSEPLKIQTFIRETIRQGGLDITPLKKKLKELVDEDKVRASTVDYGLVSMSLTDLKPLEVFVNDIPEGRLHEYILASANLPAFKDDKLDNKKMIDGAFFDNLPINMLLKRGCDEVIAIRVNAIGRIQKVKKADQSKVITITPSEDLGKLLEIDTERAKYNIKMGYFDTMRVMKKLHGTRYYISNLIDEAIIMKNLIVISKNVLNEIGGFFNIEQPAYRMMFEEVIPLIGDLLKADKKGSYSQLVLAYYEFLAEQAGIDRFEIMNYETLVNRVNGHYLSQIDQYNGMQDSVVNRLIAVLPNKSALLLPQKLKTELLIHIYYILLRGLRDTGISG